MTELVWTWVYSLFDDTKQLWMLVCKSFGRQIRNRPVKEMVLGIL